jgi:WD40 repeat protein
MTDLSGNGVRVLLIATATHDGPSLPSVPAVERSFQDLQTAFLERCGVDVDCLRPVLNPADARTMAMAVTEAAQQASTVLLVYFIGHGLLLTPGEELYLAARGTDRLVPGMADHQALSFSSLQKALATSRASSVVVVLDCCFSGKPPLSNEPSVPAFTSIEPAHGRYLIGSAEQLALAPPDAVHTAFTGAFLEVLEHGDPRGPHLLTLDAVYDAVFQKLRDRHRPWPRRQAGDRSGKLVIAANSATPVETQQLEEQDPTPGRCPYPGLDAFGTDDAEVFFGRKQMTNRILAELAACADSSDKPGPLVLVGPSGSGKTSLLNAGLLAGLRKDGVHGKPGSAGWPCVHLTPGISPLRRLAWQLNAATPDASDLLRENPGHAVKLVDTLLADRPDQRLIVLIDQLEELFTLCPDPAERAAFLQAVTAIARPTGDNPPRGLVVLALRADFYGRAAEHAELLTALRDRQLLVEPMTPQELRATIEQPAASVGLTLADGLADVILHELGATASGQPATVALPLLSHALWATWRKRAGSRLTVAGYRAAGGISKAITSTAEQVYGELDEPGQEAVRRMLLRLVRVGGDSADTARPVDRSTLLHGLPDPHAAQQALDRLTEARLLTLDRDTARISHEVLLHAWRRLKEWIDAGRDWLHASQQLADDVKAWEKADRDPSLLYRGNRLAAVRERADKAATDATDMEPEVAEFMDASWRHERRGVRWRRIAVALLAVLSLAAAGLATWAGVTNSEAQRQLRVANSRALAEDSTRLQNLDPRMALQLAQAAWHAAPTPQAYGALFTQYARLQSVDKVFQNLWDNNLRRIMTSPDGSVAATVNDGGLPSKWAGLNGDNPRQGVAGPQPHELTGGTFQLSPSGKLLGYANDTGTVALWDLEHHSPVVMLRDAVEPTRVVRSMAFSSDETRLLIKRTGYDGKNVTFEVWDLGGRKTIPVAEHLGPQETNTESAFLGPTPNTIVVGEFGGTAQVYNLATGQAVRSIPNDSSVGHVARNGTVVVQCHSRTDTSDIEGILSVIDVATSATQRTIPVPNCSRFELDTSTNYALIPEFNGGDTGANGQLTIVELATGDIYQLTTPPLNLLNEVLSTDRYNDKIAVFTGDDGQPVMLIGDKNLLYRQRPSKSTRRAGDPGASQAISPRGNFDVTFDRPNAMLLNDLRSRATLATTTRGPTCWGTCGPGRPLDFTPDGKRLLAVWGDTLVIYSVPTLTVEARIELPLPPELGGPPTDDGAEYEAWSSSIAPVDDNQVTVLHAGMLTRWNPADGTQVGTPTQVRTDRDGLRRSAHKAVLEPRWQHPEQAAVVEPSGDVELWNLDQHQITARLGRADAKYQGSVRFTDDGSTAGVRTPDGNIQLWDVGSAHTVGRPIPSGGRLLGFTPDRKLIVTKSGTVGAGTAQIWDQDSGKQLAGVNWPANSPTWAQEGTTLTLFGGDEIQTLELDPKLWFDTLCKHSNRDFTDDERTVLAQLGAPDERPCG